MALTVFAEQKQIDIFVITLNGSIDSETYMDLERNLSPLLARQPKAIILDMAGVDYISSMGLSVVFKTRSILQGAGSMFMLVNLRPNVKKVFDIVFVSSDLGIFASMEEADKYLARIQKGNTAG
jgi:anti-sigma B factor antagonist